MAGLAATVQPARGPPKPDKARIDRLAYVVSARPARPAPVQTRARPATTPRTGPAQSNASRVVLAPRTAALLLHSGPCCDVLQCCASVSTEVRARTRSVPGHAGHIPQGGRAGGGRGRAGRRRVPGAAGPAPAAAPVARDGRLPAGVRGGAAQSRQGARPGRSPGAPRLPTGGAFVRRAWQRPAAAAIICCLGLQQVTVWLTVCMIRSNPDLNLRGRAAHPGREGAQSGRAAGRGRRQCAHMLP